MVNSVRFVALGDSATLGVGDPVDGGWRGWARLLADAMGHDIDVSFSNVAVSGATAADLRHHQLEAATAQRPDLASLIVGLNDTMRAGWDPRVLRHDILSAADALHHSGAVLLTARFHDHGAVLGLPGILRRPMWRRIVELNAVYDEVTSTYGGVVLDLLGRPEVARREFWSMDRLHPSELGHRQLAWEFAHLLQDVGLHFPLPSLVSEGTRAGRLSEARWLLTEGVPWIARRAGDLGPWATRLACAEVATMLRLPESAVRSLKA